MVRSKGGTAKVAAPPDTKTFSEIFQFTPSDDGRLKALDQRIVLLVIAELRVQLECAVGRLKMAQHDVSEHSISVKKLVELRDQTCEFLAEQDDAVRQLQEATDAALAFKFKIK